MLYVFRTKKYFRSASGYAPRFKRILRLFSGVPCESRTFHLYNSRLKKLYGLPYPVLFLFASSFHALPDIGHEAKVCLYPNSSLFTHPKNQWQSLLVGAWRWIGSLTKHLSSSGSNGLQTNPPPMWSYPHHMTGQLNDSASISKCWRQKWRSGSRMSWSLTQMAIGVQIPDTSTFKKKDLEKRFGKR